MSVVPTAAELAAITIVSGGQTGADRAALDFALAHGLTHTGWCPRGRLAEDGRLATRYRLRETPTARYAERTEWNVRDSDATVVLAIDAPLRGGTRLTVEFARRWGRPCLVLIRDEHPLWATATATREHAERLRGFLHQHAVGRLNIAGPRASQQPQVGLFVRAVLAAALGA